MSDQICDAAHRPAANMFQESHALSFLSGFVWQGAHLADLPVERRLVLCTYHMSIFGASGCPSWPFHSLTITHRNPEPCMHS